MLQFRPFTHACTPKASFTSHGSHTTICRASRPRHRSPLAAGAVGDAQESHPGSQLTKAVLAAAPLLFLSTCAAASASELQPLYQLAELDAATAHTLESILRPLFAIASMLYIIRIPMTWYPSIDGTKFPWLVAYAPTEPVLKATRKVIPLVGGVDITPIVLVGLLSFFNEILLGPQGILMLIQRQAAAGLLQ